MANYLDHVQIGTTTYEIHDSRFAELAKPMRFIGVTTITGVVNGAEVATSGLTT